MSKRVIVFGTATEQALVRTIEELKRENAELREARDQLTADFRAQAKQLTQCNRELAQQISQRKIREQLASAQKEATP